MAVKSKAVKARIKNFERITEELKAQGYQSSVECISIVKANVVSIFIGIVAAIFMGALYVFLHGTSAITFRSIFSDIINACIMGLPLLVVHEGLHGITWACFCENKWKSVQFGFLWKYLTPYCSCLEVLDWRKYIIGGLMPFLVLGLGSYAISLYTGSFMLLVLSVINVIGASGDLMVSLRILQNHEGILLDLPEECGYMRFYK